MYNYAIPHSHHLLKLGSRHTAAPSSTIPKMHGHALACLTRVGLLKDKLATAAAAMTPQAERGS